MNAQSASNTHEIANELVALCREGKFSEAQEKLYSNDVISLEPNESPMKEVRGMEAVRQKGEYFANTTEMHNISVSEPLVAGNHFAISMTMDATDKASGNRQEWSEVCVYEVKDGKVVKEQFFF